MKSNSSLQNTTFSIEGVENANHRARAVRVISELPQYQQTVFLMCDYGLLSIEETAASMKISSRMAASYLRSARARVQREIEGKDEITSYNANETYNESAFKPALEAYAQETITDEEIDNALDPILKEIDEGRFDKPKRSRYSIIASPVAALTIVAALIIGVAFFTNGAWGNRSEVITNGDVPLAWWGIPGLVENTLQGRVYHENSNSGDGVGGVELLLLSKDGDVIERVVSDQDGSFSFKGFSDGIYRLMAVLTNIEGASFSSFGDLRTVEWVVVDGAAEMVFSKDGTRLIEGVGIPIRIAE